MMKRIGQIAVTLILVMLIPTGFISGQEKKEQKQIKVIVSDKDGKQSIIIDTTFNGSASNVKVLEGQPITIMEGDGGEKVVIVKSGAHAGEAEEGHVMTWSASSSGENGNVVYVTKAHQGMKDGEVKYNIEVRQDESGNKTEKTSYVIAKDGMVVTIEGGSEEKVKELAGVIESKLGVKKDDKATKTEVLKEDTKKTTKK
jgi:hypothetical protein